MRFGTKVWLKRGSPGQTGMGKLREVQGVLVGRRAHGEVQVRLLEDDPFATVEYCTKAGETGWWGASCIRPV